MIDNPILAAMAESDWQAQVLRWAERGGWKIHHSRPARGLERAVTKMRDGVLVREMVTPWRTQITGDPGYPDLTLARDGVTLHAELKTTRGKPSKEQQEWAEAIGATYRLWRPSNFNEVRKELTGE